MPYTVEATGNGSDGGEEGVGHPDGEDGIFLPDTLPCSNVISRGLANVTPYGELYPTAAQGDEGDAEECG